MLLGILILTAFYIIHSALKEESTVYKQRDTSVPRKHQANYRHMCKWGTTKTRNIHGVVNEGRSTDTLVKINHLIVCTSERHKSQFGLYHWSALFVCSFSKYIFVSNTRDSISKKKRSLETSLLLLLYYDIIPSIIVLAQSQLSEVNYQENSHLQKKTLIW